MSEYRSELLWQREGQDFLDNRYSRRHVLRFDGGAQVLASSSPHILPPPLSDVAAVDPEELFVASLSSCHMLWFLALAAKDGLCVDRYQDHARGTMARNAQGRMAMSEVLLRPQVQCSGEQRPDLPALQALHHAAHEQCFIANSVTTVVRCEPIL